MKEQRFFRISDQVLVLEPSLEHLTSDTVDHGPSTVMLFGWGDGLLKHVAKYSAGYRVMYPGARIVVILSPISKAMFSTYAQRTRSMLVALKAAMPRRASAPGNPQGTYPNNRILLHCFSNTGGINLVATLNAYKQWLAGAEWTKTIMGDIPMETSKVLPHRLLICDSTPGGFKYAENIWRWSYAMALGLAPYLPWPFVVTKLLCSGVLSVSHFLTKLFGSMSIPEHSCRSIIDPEFVDITASRLYIASKADDIILWKHVVENGEHAREKGYDARIKLFQDSPHVGHMRMYPEEYWLEIGKAWKAALSKSDRRPSCSMAESDETLIDFKE
jgi:hypothetical protein